ncbi:MAG: GAF domain-containing protein [Elusimicrobia bacterium]|nr:GAF domain-containing protein [Elusimicrobiota bacterium]
MLGTYHLNVLYDILKNIHFLYQSDRIYVYLLENLLKAIDADAASLFVCDIQKKTLVLKGCLGPKKSMVEMISEEVPFAYGKGICGWAAQFNQPVLVEDVQKDSRFNPQFDTLTGYKTKSMICAPISSTEDVLGVIEILNKKSSAFNKNDLDLLALIGKQAAIALENGRLYLELVSLKSVNEKFTSTFPTGVIVINSSSIITEFNPIAEKFLLLSGKDLIGKKMNEAFNSYPSLLEELTQTLQSKDGMRTKELNLERQGQTFLKLSCHFFSIKDQAQKLIGAAMIFRALDRDLS